MLVKQVSGRDDDASDIVHMLRVENQALKEETQSSRSRIKDLEFENEQLRSKNAQIGELYQRIEQL